MYIDMLAKILMRLILTQPPQLDDVRSGHVQQTQRTSDLHCLHCLQVPAVGAFQDQPSSVACLHFHGVLMRTAHDGTVMALCAVVHHGCMRIGVASSGTAAV